LRRIEARGRHETAHRVRALAGRVLRFAMATGRAPARRGRGFEGRAGTSQIPELCIRDGPRARGRADAAIDGYSGHPVTALALKLAPLVFVRPSELRYAEWSEFDLPNAEWRIPAARMKMGELHSVPLSRQALAILNELKPLARGGRYLFPSLRTREASLRQTRSSRATAPAAQAPRAAAH
jgi:integrase